MTTLPSSDKYAGLAADLQSARQVIESNFLSAGDVLTKSIDGIDALIASLDKLAKALDAQSVAATTEDLQKAAATLLGLADNHRARQSVIDELCVQRENLARQVSDMRSSLSYMRAFTVNIKIVSGGIAQGGKTFEAFAQEISDCIESGYKELKQIEDEIVELKGGLATAKSQGATLTGRIHALLPALPNELSESAVKMGEHYGRVSTVAGEVTGIARNIQQHVVRALQALQVGDITRQRVEHVEAGLAYLMESRDKQQGDGRLAALGYGLLEALLTGTIVEFHREVDRVEQAMADMAAHSRELLKLRDMTYGDGGEGFLNALNGRIEQARVLVNEIENADAAALTMGCEMAAATEQLGTRISAIQSIKNDVQYMALNTTIKCAQIGDAARPLSVIAIELRDHGRHLENAAANGMSDLDELTRTAGALVAPGDGAGQVSATQALDLAARLIRDASERTESEISVLVSSGEAVLGVLDQSSSRLAFRDKIGGKLEMVAAELKLMAEGAQQDVSGLQEPLGVMLEVFDGLYTMAQEREVHQAFVAAVALRVPRHNPAKAA
jgi:hypothetical protein